LSVLMLARPDLLTYPGGDTTQVLKTAEALRKIGVKVDINPREIDYGAYDLMHFFNIIDPEDILGHIRSTKLPFVVSTIYCLYEEYDRYHRKDLIGWAYRLLPTDGVEYLKTIAKWLIKGDKINSKEFFWRGHSGSIKEIIRNAACLLPNSESEYKRLVQDYGLEQRYVVVPNGVDLDKFQPQDNSDRDLVICVARIEGRKNQLNLIKALNDTAFEVYIIGKPALNQPKYYEECRAIAKPNIHFTGYVSNEELMDFYNRAKVHILPSWFETTGLSSLEAALMGCNVIVTDKGDVRDYFQDDTWYCDPSDPSSILEAVSAAYQAPFPTPLVERIHKVYNWEKAAQRTMLGYQYAVPQFQQNTIK